MSKKLKKYFSPWLLCLMGSVALAGCGGSRINLKPDSVMQRAQKNLKMMTKRVNASEATTSDKALFMQAESFYQYRYQFQKRSTLGYLAQTVASLTDFAALQAVAGGVDLFSLRLKGSDGAVHLWESLLKTVPDTPLRSLTLYRLGWAYRNVGVSGFPRESGDEAFILLEKESPHSYLADLAKSARDSPWKSKSRATAWSLIPGMGQFYVGEYGNGTVRFTVGLAGLATVLLPTIIAARRSSDLKWKKDWPLLLTGVIGLGVISLDYTQAFEDALRGVMQFNERQEANFQDEHPEAP